MKRFLRSLVVATGAVVALSAGAAGAAVTVTFTQPESYADMPFANWDKEQVMKASDALLPAFRTPGSSGSLPCSRSQTLARQFPGCSALRR